MLSLKCPFGHKLEESGLYSFRWYCSACQRNKGNGYYSKECLLPFTFYEERGIKPENDPFKSVVELLEP